MRLFTIGVPEATLPKQGLSGYRSELFNGRRGSSPMLDLEPEENWLRHRLRRLRTILRYAKEPRVESGLRELIADAEDRLDLLEQQKMPQSK